MNPLQTFIEKTLERLYGRDQRLRSEAEAINGVISELRKAPKSDWERICSRLSHDLAVSHCAVTKQSELKLMTEANSWNLQQESIAEALRINGFEPRPYTATPQCRKN